MDINSYIDGIEDAEKVVEKVKKLQAIKEISNAEIFDYLDDGFKRLRDWYREKKQGR